MKRIYIHNGIRIAILMSMCCAGGAMTARGGDAIRGSDESTAGRRFSNPILKGTHSDPSICRVGDDYYLVTASFGYWPNVPVYHSRDLVHWRRLGYCLNRPGQIKLNLRSIKEGTWASTIRHHDGLFYMTTTLMGQPGGGRNLIVTARNPAGPWSDPVWVDQGGIDPSLFWDDDGVCYYVTTTRLPGRSRNDIVMSVIDPVSGRRLSDIKPLWTGIGELCPEGPHLYKIGKRYYLFIAEGGTYGGHMENVARADSIWGPYESCPRNPILTHRQDSSLPIQFAGHGDLVQLSGGSWWMVHLGVRCSSYQKQHLGRETFLVPVSWNADGWPIVNGGKGITELEMPAPNLPPQPWPEEPGRDEFDDTTLKGCWNHIGDVRVENYSLTERRGWMRLRGGSLTLDGTDGPTFIGRRQRDFDMRATTQLDFAPSREGEEAGLTAYMDSMAHYDVGVGLRDGRRVVFVRLRLERMAPEIACLPLTPGPVELAITGRKEFYTFSYRQDGKGWRKLGEASTRYLCAEVADTFTGVYLGLYATGSGRVSAVPADFNWFNYQSGREENRACGRLTEVK